MGLIKLGIMLIVCTYTLENIIDYSELEDNSKRYPDSFEWSQEIRIIEVALYIEI